MPVFISHRTADDEIAQRVAHRLRYQHHIDCYIDDIDDELGKARGTPAVTSLIVRRLNQCTNLVAIVSANTVGSWWVPFEVGVARQSPRVITTFTNQQDSTLPEYLLEWPRLRGEQAVDQFAKLYNTQQRALNEKVLQKRAMASEQLSVVDQFHYQLKTILGQ